MDNVIPGDSRYTPLTQQKWLCVPTCIQMIMLKHNIPLLPAELMGFQMKLIVPKKNKFLFWDKNVKIGKKPKAGYGSQLSVGKGIFMNNILKKLKIPLRMYGNHIERFKKLKELEEYLEKLDFGKLDVLVCYDWGTLFGKNERQGHVCVLDKIDLDKHEVRIIDPSANAPKWRIVEIEKLYEAMKVHGKNNGAGFWEFSLTKKY